MGRGEGDEDGKRRKREGQEDEGRERKIRKEGQEAERREENGKRRRKEGQEEAGGGHRGRSYLLLVKGREGRGNPSLIGRKKGRLIGGVDAVEIGTGGGR